jgi:twitching motility protein PilT
MSDIQKILREAAVKKASDVFIVAGLPISFRINEVISPRGDERVMPAESEALVRDIYKIANRDISRYMEHGDDDFSMSLAKIARFRVCVYRQRGSMAAVIRVVAFGIPDWKKCNIPDEVMRIADRTKGMVIVTGPAGSGKSTTLACVIDQINHTRNGHIITLEDPIEYVYRNDKCVVSQREIGLDTDSYIAALRASLRQAPDVILLGEMRDLETIKTAVTAAETGHLLISTLHTAGAVATIDRIIDVFPPQQQPQIRVQLALLLQTIVSQQLLPSLDGSLIPAFEIMHVNPAIRNMIRESKTHQIDACIYAGAREGMITMDASILALYKSGKISSETAVYYAANPDGMERRIKAGE